MQILNGFQSKFFEKLLLALKPHNKLTTIKQNIVSKYVLLYYFRKWSLGHLNIYIFKRFYTVKNLYETSLIAFRRAYVY